VEAPALELRRSANVGRRGACAAPAPVLAAAAAPAGGALLAARSSAAAAALMAAAAEEMSACAGVLNQGLTLVQLSAQLEPCLTHKNTLHTLNTP